MRALRIATLLAALLVMFVAAHSDASTLVRAVTVFGYTSETYSVSVNTKCTDCDVQWDLVSYSSQVTVQSGKVAAGGPRIRVCGVDSVPINFKLPRLGHYYIQVRNCNAEGCSANISSMSEATSTVNCEPSAFWFYGTLQPPGTPVFQ